MFEIDPAYESLDGETVCLFCGKTLSMDRPGEIHWEHVFPAWLQREYNLADCELVLANNTYIRYRNLKVAACQPCNNSLGSRIESRVAAGTADDQTAWTWMLKIHIGILFWESGKPLSQDRRTAESERAIMALHPDSYRLFRASFAALASGADFYPNPIGSLVRVKRGFDAFNWSDRMFSNRATPEYLFSAAMMSLRGEAWIAFFDDGSACNAYLRRVTQNAIESGDDPTTVFPIVMYERSRIPWFAEIKVSGDESSPDAVVVSPMDKSSFQQTPFDNDDASFFVKTYWESTETVWVDFASLDTS